VHGSMASLPAFRENGSARTQTQSGSNPSGIEPEPLEDRGQLDSRLSMGIGFECRFGCWGAFPKYYHGILLHGF